MNITAIENAINEIDKYFNEKDSKVNLNDIVRYTHREAIAKILLNLRDVEKEQILNAFKHGKSFGQHLKAEDYFKTTYPEQKREVKRKLFGLPNFL